MSAPVYLALVHHPVRDRQNATVTTAVTNLDVHDLARSCRTYGLAGYYVITPIEAQRALVERILRHWRDGSGARRIPERAEALALVRVRASVQAAAAEIEAAHGAAPVQVVTAAAPPAGLPLTEFDRARDALARPGRPPWMLLFGTGHGLAENLLATADRALAPIRPGGYNHLSVRAAVAIVLDRLFGG